MTWRGVWCLLATLSISHLSLGQEARDDDDLRPARAATIPTEGFWPTPLMLERMLDRLSEKLAEEYEMDDDQLDRVQELLQERIPKFLTEHRGEIQTLMNQFFEAQFAGEAPEVDHVANWSQRLLPLIQQFKEMTHDTADEMRGFLNEDQVSKLDVELAAFDAGLSLATNKVRVWADGGYDPETEWLPDRRQRRRVEHEERLRLRAEMQAARAHAEAEQAARAANGEAAGSAPAPAELTTRPPGRSVKDEWEQYADAFARRFDFTTEQKQEADRQLRTRQRERDEYLRRKAGDFRRIDRGMRDAKTDEERVEAAAAFDRLNEPIEKMFEKLKDKLDRIPTRAQRQRAESQSPQPSGNGSLAPPG
jgi:hypothetical protein